jgi:hypothetical protein
MSAPVLQRVQRANIFEFFQSCWCGSHTYRSFFTQQQPPRYIIHLPDSLSVEDLAFFDGGEEELITRREEVLKSIVGVLVAC